MEKKDKCISQIQDKHKSFFDHLGKIKLEWDFPLKGQGCFAGKM